MAAQHANRLTRADLVSGLRDLVERLHDDGLETSVYIVGGAALSLSYDSGRGTTDDIDAKLSPAPRCLDHAATIARARGWADDWLNTSAEVFTRSPGTRAGNSSGTTASPGCGSHRPSACLP